MCEEVKAIDNLPQILSEVQGIGVVLIGEGDLSQNLGYPRQYDHPAVVEAMTAIRRICKEHDVPCGHPHVESHNMSSPATSSRRGCTRRSSRKAAVKPMATAEFAAWYVHCSFLNPGESID